MSDLSKIVGIILIAYWLVIASSLLMLFPENSILVFIQQYAVFFWFDSTLSAVIGVYLILIRKSGKSKKP